MLDLSPLNGELGSSICLIFGTRLGAKILKCEEKVKRRLETLTNKEVKPCFKKKTLIIP